MKNFQARMEDKLRIISNYTDYSLHKIHLIFTKKDKFPSEIKKVLVIELKRIGDILVATPALRALKKSFSQADIDIVVLPGMEEVLYGNKNIHQVFVWDRDKIKKNYSVYLQQIKDKYNLAVILHNGTYEVSKLLKDANIPYRIGCTRVGFREPKGYSLTKQLLPDKKLKHKIEDNLDVLKLININNNEDKSPEAYTTKEAEVAVKNLLKKKRITNKDFIVVLHTVSWTHPTWFKKRFAELADKLIEKYKAKTVFVGTEKEERFVEEIILLMKNKSINLAGKTSIQELFALIKTADLVVGIDSASTNIAAAFKTPVIALFGAGDKIIWAPHSENSISIQKDESCTACMRSECKWSGERNLECMKAITVEDVLSAVEKLIK